MAILPFLIYELGGFGTLGYVVSKPVNWAVNALVLCLIVATVCFQPHGRIQRRTMVRLRPGDIRPWRSHSYMACCA